MQRCSKGWDEQSKYVDRPSHWSLSQAWGQGADRGRRDTRPVFRCGSPCPRQPFWESGVRRSSCELRGPPPLPRNSRSSPFGSHLEQCCHSLPHQEQPFPHRQMAAQRPGFPRPWSFYLQLSRCGLLLGPPAPSRLCVEPFLGVSLDTRGADVAWLWSSRPGTAQGWSGWCSQLLSESCLPLGWMHPKAKDWGCFCLPRSPLL